MTRRVLITGAAGFIGSNFAAWCLTEGWDVTGVDDMSNGHKEFLPTVYPTGKFRLWAIDFTAWAVIDSIVRGKFDYVVHLAATPRVSYSVEHPLETHTNNVTKTLKLIDVCRGNVNRFVFASSSSVYGGADVLPTPETAPKNPQSPYALQKSQIEEYLQLYAQLYGLDSTCLRFFNVFGRNQISGGAYSTAISAWLNAIKQGRLMRSDGDGLQSRDMCHVDNVCDALVRAVKCDSKLDGEVFNVACGDRTTNKAILELLMKRYPGVGYVNAAERVGDVKHTHADITKIEKILGYIPLVRFGDGFEKTCDWFDENWNWVQYLKQGM